MASREIERKWLCTGFTKAMPTVEQRIKYQSYLWADDNVEIRLACNYDPLINALSNFKVTNKLGNGLVRTELQYNITGSEYDEMMTAVKGAPIHKKFETYDLGGGRELVISCVDKIWYYAEVEFASEEEAEAFDPMESLPADLQFVEVTGKPQYQMKNYWRRTRLGDTTV